MSTLLPYPYDTNCFTYSATNKASHVDRNPAKLAPHPFFSKPLSQNDCVFGCLGRKTLETCNCWPPEIPYVSSEFYAEVVKTDTIKLCDWIKKGDALNKSRSLKTGNDSQANGIIVFNTCFSNSEMVSSCNRKCPRECNKSRIKARIQYWTWPSQERIQYAPKDDRIQLMKYQNCCAVISVRLSNNEVTSYTYAPKHESVEFISYVGGIISLYLGFTFIAIFDYVKVSTKFIMKQFRKKNAISDRKSGKVRRTFPSDHFSEKNKKVIPWYKDHNNAHKTVIRSFVNPVPVDKIQSDYYTTRKARHLETSSQQSMK